MIKAELVGLDEVISAVRRISTAIDRRAVFEDVAQQFSARLRAATPKGYSGRLKDSVIYAVDDEQAEVGYEAGVETAGDPSLDSVLKPRRKSKSVLARNWVKADQLESVLQEAFEAYAPDGVILMESRLLEEVTRGLP